MAENEHLIFMQRALELAALPGTRTRPNPQVGAVIVHRGNIIGEGYHRLAGGPHAEKIAIETVRNKKLLKESSLYVNLEPCSHQGKTPPCADMILDAGIPEVYVASRDTSLKVSGRGIEKLRRGGCRVTTGIMEREGRAINRRFFTYHERQRPYIMLKWAMSNDGFIDIRRVKGENRRPNWITGKDEQLLVHRWRTEEHSILVGASTVRTDNPSLDVRLWSGPDPLRLILSYSGRLDHDLKVLNDRKPLVVYTHNPGIKVKDIEEIPVNSRESAISEILEDLYRRGIQSVMVEGGSSVLNQFIKKGLWDEARIFTGKMKFGSGIAAPGISGTIFETIDFEKSILKYYLND